MNKTTSPEILQKALLREKKARKQAEKILEDKSLELYRLTEELKHANEKLKTQVFRKSSELDGVFQNLVDAYVVIDFLGNVVEMNDSAIDLFGYDIKKDKLNVTRLIFKDDFEYAIDCFKKLISDSRFIDYQARVYTKNIGIRTVHINASLIKNHEGKAIAAQGIVRDITDQLNLENKQKQLLKTLEKSNQELNDYAHIVSHDIKSPLRSINALVHWIKEDYHEELKGPGLENIALIEKTLEKMEDLISGILNYSGAGNKDTLIDKSIDLNTIIEDIKNTIFIPKNVAVYTKTKLPTILGDRTRIQQLFQNIISNAVNYIDKPEGIVEIAHEEKGSYYKFSIRDNGIGIKKEYHEKIFKIFQSLGQSEHSTGIGLSIVKKIIDLYEGDVWLESEPGIGTTFFFTLKK